MIATATAAATEGRGLQASAKPEWFAGWFDSEHYHRLYAHRDGREAAAFIDRLIACVQLTTGTTGSEVLDLGCGSGRHAVRLASHGLRVTGLDLSTASLALARRRAHELGHAGARVHLVRQDMRQPFGDDAFDCVFSLFTSFGYFDDPSDHLTVARNMAASLRVGGRLIVDYLNVHRAERQLVAEETITRDEVRFRISRWSDAEAIYKRIVIEDPRSVASTCASASAPLEYIERVAKLTLEDFRFLFALNGLHIESACGDDQLGPFDVEASPRLILFARKAPREILADATDCLGRHAEI